jgi:hypothetical protein
MTCKVIATLAVFLWIAALASAQLTDGLIEPDHPAIGYDGPATDRVARLNRRVQAGETRLEFEERSGYLRSLLTALDIPIESQIALFSGTSLQGRLVNEKNPRTIFFNDSTAVGWMPGGFIEIASLDPRLGAIFYILPQTATPSPQLVRDTRCLQCHYAAATLGVPGFLVRSIPSSRDGTILPWLGNYTTDHRSPLSERWGGWYVTGRGGGRHLGNAPIADRTLQSFRVEDANLDVGSLANRFDTRRYVSPYSDIAALMVFDHQMRMMNLLTRLGWEARILEHERRLTAASLEGIVKEVVDYLLFVDETPIEPVRGSSAFAQRFSARGPRDGKGRSLRDLDLERRLFRYPCSYMIYSDAFVALPHSVRSAVYERLWRILSGSDSSPEYAKLAASDRRAIVEILRDTKTDLPSVFRSARY